MDLSKNAQKILCPIPAVYLHIPFCRTLCPFCSFAISRERASMHEKYILGIIDEIARRSEMLTAMEPKEGNEKYPGQDSLKSIYFGGGTPSCFTIQEVSVLIKKVRDYFRWSDQIEIAFEMNPDDVNPEYLSGLKEIGVNRLSLGGQSFQTSTLHQLKRCHTTADLREAIASITDSPFVNWNIDLMFGVPEQSFSMFKKDVEEALAYDPTHISLYGLEIHERTPFGKNPQVRRWESEHQEHFEAMYLWATGRLEKAGLFQYEVSNFSKKTYEARNNLLVWSGQQYLGVGVGAHSYHMLTRWGNSRSIKTYLQHLENNEWPTEFEERLSGKQLATEFLMLGLRQRKGINIEKWLTSFGLKWQKQHAEFVQRLCDEERAFWEDQHLCLTPKGMLLADKITVQLMPKFNED